MKTYLIAAAAAAAMALSATQAGAGILAAGNNSLGGTTSALEPQLAGTVVQDIDTADDWIRAELLFSTLRTSHDR